MGLPLFDYCGIKIGDHCHPLHSTWYMMVHRCHYITNWSWFHYGGRGIVVCDRWRFGERKKTGFQCWLSDMGPKPAPWYSIDRIDPDGNYEPSNCRWATPEVQAQNKRSNPIKVCPVAESLRHLVVRTCHFNRLNRRELRRHVNALLTYGEPEVYYNDKRHLRGILK